MRYSSSSATKDIKWCRFFINIICKNFQMKKISAERKLEMKYVLWEIMTMINTLIDETGSVDITDDIRNLPSKATRMNKTMGWRWNGIQWGFRVYLFSPLIHNKSSFVQATRTRIYIAGKQWDKDFGEMKMNERSESRERIEDSAHESQRLTWREWVNLRRGLNWIP